MNDTKSVYWYVNEETDTGTVEVEWQVEFAPGEYLGLYRDGVDMDEKEYPDEWEHGAQLASEPYS